MSNVSTLFNENDYMVTFCPTCGERIGVYEEDYYATLDDGTKEYYLECDNEDCLCTFYANVNY